MYALLYNPLYYTVILVPIITLPAIYFTGHYLLLITTIPLTCTSILYHHKFKIKNIRKYDICLSFLAYHQQLFYNFLYASNYTFTYFYFSVIVFYLLDKLFEKYNYIQCSILFHAIMHLTLILCILITILNTNKCLLC